MSTFLEKLGWKVFSYLLNKSVSICSFSHMIGAQIIQNWSILYHLSKEENIFKRGIWRDFKFPFLFGVLQADCA